MTENLNQSDITYSPRSQRSMIEEDRLRGDLAKIDGLIGFAESKISKLEADKARCMRDARRGKPNELFLSQTMAELENKSHILRAYKEQRASIEAEIALLTPTAHALELRMKAQERLARLASERLEKDRQVNGALAGLRKALRERSELTARMDESAGRVDFSSESEFLYTQDYEALLASLPGDLLAKSESWTARFLGKQKGTKLYVARDRFLVVPETLASSNVYRFGERVELSEDQARDLLREDRARPNERAPWRCAPPSIMTIEAWESASAAAAEHGITILEFLLWQDWQRDATGKAGYEYKGEAIPQTKDDDEKIKLKVRVKGDRKVQTDGGVYSKGDAFELHVPAWRACEMFEEGTIERP